jgi:sec-independent protein translocase protein TatB
MFNIGPLELGVIMLVGLIVLGPERLPGLIKDAARMLKSLREMATGARTQLRDELGPEFADLNLDALRELRALNPKTALSRMLLPDEDEPVAGAEVLATEQPPAVELAKPPAASQPPLGRNERAPYDADAT